MQTMVENALCVALRSSRYTGDSAETRAFLACSPALRFAEEQPGVTKCNLPPDVRESSAEDVSRVADPAALICAPSTQEFRRGPQNHDPETASEPETVLKQS